MYISFDVEKKKKKIKTECFHVCLSAFKQKWLSTSNALLCQTQYYVTPCCLLDYVNSHAKVLLFACSDISLLVWGNTLQAWPPFFLEFRANSGIFLHKKDYKKKRVRSCAIVPKPGWKNQFIAPWSMMQRLCTAGDGCPPAYLLGNFWHGWQSNGMDLVGRMDEEGDRVEQ